MMQRIATIAGYILLAALPPPTRSTINLIIDKSNRIPVPMMNFGMKKDVSYCFISSMHQQTTIIKTQTRTANINTQIKINNNH
jgi:hypothetical protein